LRTTAGITALIINHSAGSTSLYRQSLTKPYQVISGELLPAYKKEHEASGAAVFSNASTCAEAIRWLGKYTL
jgi:hypothetical protein